MRHRRAVARELTLFGVGLLTVSLTGCGPTPFIVAQLDDGVVSAALCTDQTVDSVTFFATTDGREWRELWAVASADSIRAGTIVATGQIPTGITSDASANFLVNPDDEQVQVHFEQMSKSGDAVQDWWTSFDVDELSDQDWLSASGERSGTACG